MWRRRKAKKCAPARMGRGSYRFAPGSSVRRPAAAYYVASEALANVAKHSQANLVDLAAKQDGGVLAVWVRDDGVGGVDPSRGSG
jgi:signal transduction histidine kinase